MYPQDYQELLRIQEQIQRREITIIDGLIQAWERKNPSERQLQVINTQGHTVYE
jgi:hypothetical protein